jgi:type III restriction enzyme
VRNFATSQHIQIMVVTVGAINKKDVNNLYKDSEKTGGEKPIDLIRATRPILIVDEPQSVDGGLEGRGKRPLDAMNPLCTLRYSATHVDKHHMVYRLDAVDAYERKLVKQIEVASAEVEGGHNKAYVRLSLRSNGKGSVTAQGGARRAGRAARWCARRCTVQDGDDLEQTHRTARSMPTSGRRDPRAGTISFVELRMPGGEQFLQAGEAMGDVDGDAIKRQMIRARSKSTWTRKAPCAAGHQGAEPVLHRRGGALPAVRRGRRAGEGQVRADVRGRIRAAREAPDYQRQPVQRRST